MTAQNENFNVLENEPLTFSKGEEKVPFTRSFLLLDKVTLTNNWKGLLNGTFTLHLLNRNGPISNTFELSNVLLYTL